MPDAFTKESLEQAGVRINGLTVDPAAGIRAAFRPIYRVFGGKVQDAETNPGRISSLITKRNPRTMRQVMAIRNLNGTWNVQKRHFGGSVRGYSVSDVKRFPRRLSFEQAAQIVVDFQKITAANPPEHSRYNQKPFRFARRGAVPA